MLYYNFLTQIMLAISLNKILSQKIVLNDLHYDNYW